MTIEELQKELDTANGKLAKEQAERDKLSKERDEWKSKFDENKTERDAAKDRERKALEEKGEYDKALKMLSEQLEPLKTKASEYDTMKAAHESVASKLKAIEDKEREEILATLPPEKKAEFEDTPIDFLRKIRDIVSVKNTQVNIDRDKTTRINPGTKKVSDMNYQEQVEYMNAHGGAKALTEALIRERRS